ncbi:NAD(P)H-dependent amine dehydrogenase family protein [Flavisphingomonas formosensis]|uniref:NAD(P)H-dependent amine dehydrogenase family protein n=1 Tax=Flavisphingomonas formosensis TaxID=861534 RepID=UPI0012F90BC8|nr:hypothetical protein [Sphingomonas formosensis]
MAKTKAGGPIRIIQWGLGGVGSIALREMLSNPMFEVIAVKAFSAEKAGRDAGELVGVGPIGVPVTVDIDALPFDRADCVMYCPRMTDYDEVAAMLRKGVNVVTIASNVYPLYYGQAVFDTLNDAAKEGGVSFHGSGINPAFISDLMAITISGVVHQATHINVQEISDVTVYAMAAPEIMFTHTDFGSRPEDVKGPDTFLSGMDDYFSESIRMICDHLGVTLDRIEHGHDWATTNVPITLPNGRVIEKDTIACRRFQYFGVIGGERRIRLATAWKLGADLTPNWDVSTSGMVEWTITVEGSPSFQCKVATAKSFNPDSPDYLKGSEDAALIATAVHAINGIPYVVDAAPGVRTFLDLPPIGSQGAFRRPLG